MNFLTKQNEPAIFLSLLNDVIEDATPIDNELLDNDGVLLIDNDGVQLIDNS